MNSFFSQPFTSAIWVPEILQVSFTRCGSHAWGQRLNTKTGRARDRAAEGHRESWDESVTRLLGAGDRLAGEGGGKGVLRRGTRRDLGESFAGYMVVPCLEEGALSYWSDSS